MYGNFVPVVSVKVYGPAIEYSTPSIVCNVKFVLVGFVTFTVAFFPSSYVTSTVLSDEKVSNFETPTDVIKLYCNEFWDRIEMLLECDLSDEKLSVVLGDNLD